MTPDSRPAVPADAGSRAFVFAGRRGPLLGLLLKNLALTVLTLGIYRFWAKTAVRRFFWSHTYVLDDPLEYAGTGRELLFGFLIALLFLVPIGFVYGLISAVVSPVPSPGRIAVEASYYLGLLFLIQLAVYRIWRYRLSRTLWRGIRFGLDGSSLGYAAISMGWLFLTAVTLGVAHPWRVMALWRYRLNHTRFGSTPVRLEAPTLPLLPWWLAVMLVPLAGLGMTIAGMRSGQDAATLAGVALAVIGGTVCYALFRVREARLVINGTRLDEAAFRSDLRAAPILTASLVLLAIAAAAVGTATSAILDVAEAVERAELGGLPAPALDAGAFAVIAVLLFLTVVLPLLSRLILQVAVVRALTASTDVDGRDLLERTAQATDRGPTHGEGLADAFDVGAI